MAIDLQSGVDIRISTARAAQGARRLAGLFQTIKKETGEVQTSLKALQTELDKIANATPTARLATQLGKINAQLNQMVRLSTQAARNMAKLRVTPAISPAAQIAPTASASTSNAKRVNEEAVAFDRLRKAAAANAKQIQFNNTITGKFVNTLKRVRNSTPFKAITAGAKGAAASIDAMNARFLRAQRNMRSGGRGIVATFDKIRLSAFRVQGILAVFGIGFGIGALVNTIKDFEQSMSAVAAITITGKNNLFSLADATAGANIAFDALRETARELGRETIFTASQSADAMRLLAQAGFEANEVIAAIPGTLDLAVSGATDLSTAANLVASTVRAFGLSAGEAGRVADVFATVVTRSNTNVTSLGEALKFVAPAAKAAGVSLESTAAAIGILADAGIKGTLAGTALRRFISGLVRVTPQATEVLNRLGLSLADINPRVNSLATIFQKFADKGLGVADAFRLFDLRGGPAVIVLTSMIDRFIELERAANDAEGTAAAMANVMRDNLAGDLKILLSVVQDAILEMGENGLNGTLRSLVQGMTDLVRVMSGVRGPFSDAAERVGFLDEAIKALVISLATFFAITTVGRITGITAAFTKLGGVIAGAGGLTGLFNKLIGRVGVFASLSLTLARTAGGGFKGILSITRSLGTGMKSLILAVGRFGGGWGKAAVAIIAVGAGIFSILQKQSEISEQAERTEALLDKNAQIIEAIVNAKSELEALQGLAGLQKSLDSLAKEATEVGLAFGKLRGEIERLESDSANLTFGELLEASLLISKDTLEFVVDLFDKLNVSLKQSAIFIGRLLGFGILIDIATELSDRFDKIAQNRLLQQTEEELAGLTRQFKDLTGEIKFGEAIEKELLTLQKNEEEVSEIFKSLAQDVTNFGVNAEKEFGKANASTLKWGNNLRAILATLGDEAGVTRAVAQASAPFEAQIKTLQKAKNDLASKGNELRSRLKLSDESPEQFRLSGTSRESLQKAASRIGGAGDQVGADTLTAEVQRVIDRIGALEKISIKAATAQVKWNEQMREAERVFDQFATGEDKIIQKEKDLGKARELLFVRNLKLIAGTADLTEKTVRAGFADKAAEMAALQLAKAERELVREKDRVKLVTLEQIQANKEFDESFKQNIRNAERLAEAGPGVARGIERATAAFAPLDATLEDLGSTAAANLGEALTDAFIDPLNAAQNFGDFIDDLGTQIQRAVIKAFVVQPILDFVSKGASSLQDVIAKTPVGRGIGLGVSGTGATNKTQAEVEGQVKEGDASVLIGQAEQNIANLQNLMAQATTLAVEVESGAAQVFQESAALMSQASDQVASRLEGIAAKLEANAMQLQRLADIQSGKIDPDADRLKIALPSDDPLASAERRGGALGEDGAAKVAAEQINTQSAVNQVQGAVDLSRDSSAQIAANQELADSLRAQAASGEARTILDANNGQTTILNQIRDVLIEIKASGGGLGGAAPSAAGGDDPLGAINKATEKGAAQQLGALEDNTGAVDTGNSEQIAANSGFFSQTWGVLQTGFGGILGGLQGLATASSKGQIGSAAIGLTGTVISAALSSGAVGKRGGPPFQRMQIPSFASGGMTPSASEVLGMGMRSGKFGPTAIPAILHPDEAVIPTKNGMIPLKKVGNQLMVDLPGAGRGISTTFSSFESGGAADGSATFLRDTSPGLQNGSPTAASTANNSKAPIVNVTINAQDVDSFRRSKSQIAAQLGGAVQQAGARQQ